MSMDDPTDRIPPYLFGEGVYDRVLNRTREVAGKAIERLRGLSAQLPAGMVEQVERLHQDPCRERRKMTRVRDASICVPIRVVDASDSPGEVPMRDHCPTGMAVLLPCPAGVGTLLRLRMPPEFGGGWVTVEVKHCRKEGSKWLAGCELLSEQPVL